MLKRAQPRHKVGPEPAQEYSTVAKIAGSSKQFPTSLAAAGFKVRDISSRIGSTALVLPHLCWTPDCNV